MRGTSVAVCVNLLVFCYSVLAAEGAQTPSSSFGGIGALLMWYICGSRRRKEIGGWLLYYYIQIYIGVIITVVIFAFSFKNYLPEAWTANRSLYPLFLVSTVPSLLFPPAQLVVAEKLRLCRDFAFVKVLRYILWAGLGVSLVATAIDVEYFPDNLGFDAIGLIWPAVWLPYFYLSKRVKRVFATKDWLPPTVSGEVA